MDDTDDIMNIYGNKCRGVYIPNAEQKFQEKCKTESQGLLDKYGFNKKPKQEQTLNETATKRPTQQPQQEVLTEKQRKNQMIFEASVNVAKLIPLFEDVEDKKYINQMKEALEELLE